MIKLRRSHQRGHARHGWLDTHHTFSFADYYDPRFVGFRALRVINEDRVEPAAGFDPHSHRDMEILSYVLAGAMKHEDSMGNGSVIRLGDVQRMSAGSGVRHSEYNASETESLHFLQIWIVPDKTGLPPEYEQRHYADTDKRDMMRLIASREGREGSLRIHQDVDVYASVLTPGKQLSQRLAQGREAWLQVARGSVTVNGLALAAGDGAAISEEREITVDAKQDAEILFFDLG